MSLRRTLTSENKTVYTYFDILTLRPDISDLVKAVPKPKGAVIKNGLPTWNVRPLYTKLPLLPGPEGPFVFSRGKLGSNLWRSSSQTDFMLYDPYGYEVSFDYEPVHDKHLKKWFKNSRNRRHLIKHGLVTKDMDVKCSVKQYNEYRKYLQRIHSNAINKEAIIRENYESEKLVYNKVNESLQKDLKKMNFENEHEGKRKENIEKIKLAAKAKKEDCDRRLRRIYERNAYMEQKKKDDVKKSIERTRAKNEFIQNRIMTAKKLERKRKIQTLRGWRTSDLKKKRKAEEEGLWRQAEIKRKAKERWEKKVENQQSQIEKEEFLHKQRKLQMEASRKLRMKKIQTDLACLQEKILLQQGQPIVKGVIGRFKKKQKNLLNTVKNMWYDQMSKLYSQDPKTLGTLRDKIETTLADIRFDLEPYVLITEAKRRLENDLDTPEQVTDVMKSLLEEAIGISVARTLQHLLFKITHKILYAVDKIKFPETEEKKTKLILPKQVVAALDGQTIVESKPTGVSFGRSKSVERYDDLLDLKSIKNRPPTPVDNIEVRFQTLLSNHYEKWLQMLRNMSEPALQAKEVILNIYYKRLKPSVETITMAALEDPDLEYTNLPSESFSEQKKLMESIEDIGGWLLKHVERRVTKNAESFNSIASKNIRAGATALPHPLARLCNLILFATKDDFLAILDTIIMDVFKDINFQVDGDKTTTINKSKNNKGKNQL